MSALLALPVALPLAGAALCLVLGPRGRQTVAACASLGALVTAILLLVQSDQRGPVTGVVGAWPLGVGITLTVDRVSGLLLVVALIVLVAVLVSAFARERADRTWPGFAAVYLVLVAGLALAFTTGDLFTLFVAFEIVLISSSVLLAFEGRPEQARATATYIISNFFGTTLLLIAIAGIYATTGTLSFTVLAQRWPAVPDATALVLVLLLFTAFAVKAAVVPLSTWLPDSYPTAPTAMNAVFAALLTKLGVYGMLRLGTQLDVLEGEVRQVLYIAAGLTMVVGVLGAVAQDDVKRILSFHGVSQIGYMVFGIALASVAGIAATLVYLVHYIVVKAALFLVGGVIEDRNGSSALRRCGGLQSRAPVIALCFLVTAGSLAGIPPLSGFVAKVALVRAGVESGAGVLVGIALAVSLLTLFSMVKIWNAAFWGDVPEDAADAGPSLGASLPLVGLVAVSLTIAAGAAPLVALATRAAEDLLAIGGTA